MTVTHDSEHFPMAICLLRQSALLAARRQAAASGVSLDDWLEAIVRSKSPFLAGQGCADHIPQSRATCDLFAKAINCAPDVLVGQWARLESLVRADASLWVYPVVTLGDIEDGNADEPYVSFESLWSAWPRLTAALEDVDARKRGVPTNSSKLVRQDSCLPY